MCSSSVRCASSRQERGDAARASRSRRTREPEITCRDHCVYVAAASATLASSSVINRGGPPLVVVGTLIAYASRRRRRERRWNVTDEETRTADKEGDGRRETERGPGKEGNARNGGPIMLRVKTRARPRRPVRSRVQSPFYRPSCTCSLSS